MWVRVRRQFRELVKIVAVSRFLPMTRIKIKPNSSETLSLANLSPLELHFNSIVTNSQSHFFRRCFVYIYILVNDPTNKNNAPRRPIGKAWKKLNETKITTKQTRGKSGIFLDSLAFYSSNSVSFARVGLHVVHQHNYASMLHSLAPFNLMMMNGEWG